MHSGSGLGHCLPGTNVRQVYWAESEAQSRRVRAQPKIILFGGDKQRIGDDRMHVVTTLLPLPKCCASKAHQIRLRVCPRVKVGIPIHLVLIAGPSPTEQRTGIKIDNVGFESETEMGFRASALQLLIPGKSENVISQHIGRAVMLMKTSMRRPIHDIADDKHAAAAFIEINPPAAISKAADVVP